MDWRRRERLGGYDEFDQRVVEIVKKGQGTRLRKKGRSTPEQEEIRRRKKLVAIRPTRARWSRLRPVRIGRSGTALSGNCRPGRKSDRNCDNESAILRMDAGVSERQIMQGAARPDNRSGAHYRNWDGKLPVQSNRQEESAEITGKPHEVFQMKLRFLQVGQFKLPKWAKLTCQTQIIARIVLF